MYKYVVMRELEESNTAIPYIIVSTEEQAEAICMKEEKENPGFIFWTYMCWEE